MASKVINIEVGKRMVKMCMSISKGKSFQISDAFVFPTPDGAVVDGQVVNPAILGEKIRDQLTLRNITVRDAVLSIASSKIAMREVTVPAVKKDQVKNIINTNASDYFPVDITKYVVSYTVLETTKTDSRVMVYAVPSTIIEGYTGLGDAAGLIINNLDFAGNSQYQVLKGIGVQGVTMYVTIDADSAFVTFMEGNKLLMQRSLSVGGDDMVCRYMGLKEIPEEQYIEALNEISVSVDKPDLEESPETEGLDEYLNRLVMGIARSLDFFHSGEYGDRVVEKVVLMGSCCHLATLKEKIESSVGAETIWLEELENIQGLANSVDDISLYINCLGARLSPLSILPKEYLQKTGQSGKQSLLGDKNAGYIALAVFVGLSILMVGFAFFQNYMAKRELDDLNASVSSLKYAEDTYNDYLRYEAGKTNLEDFVAGADTHNKYLYDFLVELEAKMPSAISLMTADCDNEGVVLNVEVPSFNEAAVVIRQFRSFESIEVIDVSDIVKQVDEGAGFVQFTISCFYPVPTTTPAPTTEATTEDVTA